jgi:hypothetical protein
MYTNIDSVHGLEVISNWFEDYPTEISPDPKGILPQNPSHRHERKRLPTRRHFLTTNFWYLNGY